MQNAARSPTFYEFDSGEQFKVWREMDDSDEEAVVIYHSHTATAGVPVAHRHLLRERAAGALRPGSTREEAETEFRSYRILDGEVTEEPVEIDGMIRCRGRLQIHGARNPADATRASPDDVHQERLSHGHRGSHPHDPAQLHRRRQGRSKGPAPPSDELLNNLDAAHGGLRERLVDGEKLRRFVNVYLNDEDVRFLGGLETPVKDGDTVTVLPAVAGGSLTGLDKAIRTDRRCVTTHCSPHWATPRWWGCRGCPRPTRSGCGPSSRTVTRPDR